MPGACPRSAGPVLTGRMFVAGMGDDGCLLVGRNGLELRSLSGEGEADAGEKEEYSGDLCFHFCVLLMCDFFG